MVLGCASCILDSFPSFRMTSFCGKSESNFHYLPQLILQTLSKWVLRSFFFFPINSISWFSLSLSLFSVTAGIQNVQCLETSKTKRDKQRKVMRGIQLKHRCSVIPSPHKAWNCNRKCKQNKNKRK